MPQDANSKCLKELLNQAENANEHARSFDRTKVTEPVKPENKQQTARTEKPAQQNPQLHNTGRINDEAAKIISLYSTKPKEKPFSNTQSLRDSLAMQIDEEKSLTGLYDGLKTRSKSGKFEELYSLINDAKMATQNDYEVKPPVEIDNSRLTDPEELPQQESFKQEKLFYFGDTQVIEDLPLPKNTASFDSDYEKLTEKITSGEISFDGEPEDENQIVLIEDESDKFIINEDDEPLDETDINLLLAFDMMDESKYDIKEFLSKGNEKKTENKKTKVKNNEITKEHEYEYTSREQNPQVNIMLKKAIKRSRLRMLFATILTVLIFYMELSVTNSAFHPLYLSPGKFGILYILVDIQLLLFMAIILFPDLKNGLFAIFRFKLNSGTMLLLSFIASISYSTVILFTDPTNPGIKLYGFPCAVAALSTTVVNYMSNKKDYHCFRVLASKKPKYTAAQLGSNAKEADEFYKYLEETSDLYTVKKAKFVSGFFARMNRRAKGEDLFNFLIPVILAGASILFAVMLILDKDVITAFGSFSILIAASVPIASFFMIPLPVIAANKKGVRNSTAFIGNAVTEEYADASVMSFSDTEVYPAHLVKITSLRTYGDYRIDKIIPDLARVFSFVGGPLEQVFIGALSDSLVPATNARLIESAADGICVAIDGTHIFLGKKSYMRRYRFETPSDPDDDMYEKSVGSIMYVVLNESLAAKIYIKYTLNPLFDDLLKDMYKAGMCLGIKTLDPNINNDLLSLGIKFKKCPIAILKAGSPEDMNGENEVIDSGIVCNSSLHTFLKMFVVCDKARHITKSNAIITIASVFLSFIAAFFLSITGDAQSIGSVYLVLLQMIWLIPVCITSNTI